MKTTPWRKSSYSGSGDGNACVEVAPTHTHISIRDSKAPTRGTLTLQVGAFAPFLQALKGYSTVTDFARFRG
ncbi:DUF397 domain-containing protein [Streptomyces sp. SAI-170]|uniref:DUF397 domain-containing protein n=1 Tax=Streptomyces sp. SAI-170 TaxID=3377729 RepID=UPI003C7BA248